MKAKELSWYNNFLIVSAPSDIEEVVAYIDRKYSSDVDIPWRVCSGATLNLFLVVRKGVHIPISPETEVKLIADGEQG